MIVLLAPILTLWAIWRLPDGVLLTTQFLGYPIELVEAGKLQRLFATVFAISAFLIGPRISDESNPAPETSAPSTVPAGVSESEHESHH